MKWDRINASYREDAIFKSKMLSKKYIIYPGFITSKKDGQRHYVNFRQLCRLYKVRHNLCINYDTLTLADQNRIKKLNLIELKPNDSGEYSL